MASHKQGPQFMKKRFRFEYSGDNDQQYRDNWDRIFGKKETPEEKLVAEIFEKCKELDPPLGTQLELPFPNKES